MATLTTFATDSTTTAGRGSPNVWSPGSDGNNWTQTRGNQTPTFSGTQLVLTYLNNTTLGVWTYSSQSQADQEVLVNVTQGTFATETVGAVLRCANSSNFYYADLGNSSGNVEIGKCVAGTFTQLASAPFSYSAGTKYSIRFQVVGQTLKARVWSAVTTEPVNWNIQATDSALYTGQFGVCGDPAGSSSVYFDTFSATNGVYVSATPVDASVGIEEVGLVAAALNADLVPSQDIGAYKSWSLHVNAVASGGTLTFQGSNDNSDFQTIGVVKASDGTTVSTTIATGIFYANRSYRYLRVRQTAWTSGATTATLELYIK